MSGVRPRRPLSPGRPTRNDAVQDQIKQLILERELAPGAPMPTEFDLMQELQISRNSVREALKALQAVGIIDIRHGFGMYVGQMSLGSLGDELIFHGRISLRHGRLQLAQLVEARELLELGLVERSFGQHTTEDLDALAAIAKQMQAEARVGTVSPQTDRAFHERLHRPVPNPLIDRLLTVFWNVYEELQDHLPPLDEKPMSVVRRHREIHASLATGTREDIVQAMTRHFDGIRTRLAAVEATDRSPSATES